mmetsp:Transcript_12322/g.17550  ORF Transcript_12322/g.17550 Transcript_12322/m.17550 type:complete len:782 (+) Transcript_12322:51-2396(+)
MLRTPINDRYTMIRKRMEMKSLRRIDLGVIRGSGKTGKINGRTGEWRFPFSLFSSSSSSSKSLSTKTAKSSWKASVDHAKAEVKASGAHPSVLSIPSVVRYGPLSYDNVNSSLEDANATQTDTDGVKKIKNAAAVIRQIGSMRRVFLTEPYFSKEELLGLAHRIRLLGKNQSLSSILLANPVVPTFATVPPNAHREGEEFLPSFAHDVERYIQQNPEEVATSTKKNKNDGYGNGSLNDSTNTPIGNGDEFSAGYNKIFHVGGGYHPLSLDPRYTNALDRRETLNALRNLALATAGLPLTKETQEGQEDGNKNDAQQLKKDIEKNNHSNASSSSSISSYIPTITVPHGLTSDGGHALLLSSYVLATQDSTYMHANPLRGLSLDPVGQSYLLPRLGCEHNQPAAQYPAAGYILALTGWKADANDMVEMGLATHYIRSYGKMGTLERALSELRPYDQQDLIRPPIRSYGGPGISIEYKANRSASTGGGGGYNQFTKHRRGRRLSNNHNSNPRPNSKSSRTAGAGGRLIHSQPLSSISNFEDFHYHNQPIKQTLNQSNFDVNTRYRNVAVANLLHATCDYDAAGQEIAIDPCEEQYLLHATKQDDPSLFYHSNADELHDDFNYHHTSTFYGDRSSRLLNIAATFHHVFGIHLDDDNNEDDVELHGGLLGIVERLRQIESDTTHAGHPDDASVIASQLLQNMYARSPLALHATYQLLQKGRRTNETLQTCMQRELNLQMNLMDCEDYANWCIAGGIDGGFNNWKHDSLNDVTKDEVEELFEDKLIM